LKRVERTVFYSAESVRIAGILLQPFMPTKASELLDMIGVDPSRRTFDDAMVGSDTTYGEAKISIGKGAWDGLFPPLPVEG
jgi:methionyl-tRNA synthetase